MFDVLCTHFAQSVKITPQTPNGQSKWLWFLMCVYEAARFLGLRVPIHPVEGAMDVCLLRVLCDVNYTSLQRADPSPRGVLPNVCAFNSNPLQLSE
jgi:hypothetical protein